MKWKLTALAIGICIIVLVIGLFFFKSKNINNNEEVKSFNKMISLGEGIEEGGIKGINPTIKKSGVIATIEPSWIFTVINQDKELVNIEYVGNRTFKYNIRLDEKEIVKPTYNAKAVLNYTNPTSLRSESIQVKGNIKESDLNKDYYFTIPEGLKEFKISIGESSTIISASADTDALELSNSDNICVAIDGDIEVSFVGSGNDWWHSNSTDEVNFYSQELDSTKTMEGIAITCLPNGHLLSYGTSSSDNYDIYSKNYSESDGWQVGYTELMDFLQMERPSCESDENNIVHCTAARTYTYYSNSTSWNSELQVGNDGSISDIAVGSDNQVYITEIGNTAEDVIIYLSSNYFSSGITMRLDGAYISGADNLDMAVRNVSGLDSDMIVTCDVMGTDLWVCNTTSNALKSANKYSECLEVDGTGVEQCTIGLTDQGRIEVIYTTTSDDAYRAYKDYGGDWISREPLNKSNVINPTIADSMWPTSNNLGHKDNYVRYVYLNSSDSSIYYGKFEMNVSTPLPPPVISNCNCSTSGDMLWTASCTYANNCTGDGNSNIYCGTTVNLAGFNITGFVNVTDYKGLPCKINGGSIRGGR